VTTDLKKCYYQLRQKETEIEKIRTNTEDMAQAFITKEKSFEEKMSFLNEAVDELTNTNNVSTAEKVFLYSLQVSYYYFITIMN
jgi:exonuclease VII small subunit